jgi:hypothetical protein
MYRNLRGFFFRCAKAEKRESKNLIGVGEKKLIILTLTFFCLELNENISTQPY